MNQKDARMILHAVGDVETWDSKWRNHYAAEKGSIEESAWKRLVEKGFAKPFRTDESFSPLAFFTVTKDGYTAACEAMCPKCKGTGEIGLADGDITCPACDPLGEWGKR